LLESVEHHRDANLLQLVSAVPETATMVGLRTSDVRTSCTCAFVSSLGADVGGWFAAAFSVAAAADSAEDMVPEN
jgi:hypothetical protein